MIFLEALKWMGVIAIGTIGAMGALFAGMLLVAGLCMLFEGGRR